MGLLVSLLEVPERLRVWQMAGVRHFYLDPEAVSTVGETPESESVLAEAAVVSPGAAAVPPNEAAAAQPSMAPSRPTAPQTPLARQKAAAAPAAASQGAEAEHAPPTRPQSFHAPQGSSDAARAALPDNPDRWPLPWPTFFAKTPPNPRLVITYRELGLDLAGQSDARRRDLWRRLIAAAGLAGQGLVAFWPLALPQGGELVEQPLHFACGVARLNPGLVAVFGEISDPARQELAARTASALVVLPPPHALCNPDPEVWEHVVATLRHG